MVSLGAGSVPTVDLVGGHVHADFCHFVHGHTVDAQFGRNTGEVEAADCGDNDLKPSRLGAGQCGRVRGNKGFPSGLERAGQVRGEAKCATWVLQTGNINVLSYRLFIRYFIRFPVCSAYLFNLIGCPGLVVGLYLFTHYALPLVTLRMTFGSD